MECLKFFPEYFDPLYDKSTWGHLLPASMFWNTAHKCATEQLREIKSNPFGWLICRSLVLVLSSGDEVAQISREELQYCGVNYCPKSTPEPSINATLEPDLEDNFATSKTKLYTLAGIYLACSLVSASVVALFVDPLSRYCIK